MSNKYTLEQENILLSMLVKNLSFEDMKKELEVLTKNELKGFNTRELLSKANHLAKTVTEFNGLPVIYNRKVYETKKGEPVVRKATLIAKIATLLEVKPDTLDSLESVTKPVLELLISKLSK